MVTCPCGSGRDFAICCEPFILGTDLPPTAEALMRSRYTAFTVKAIDYLCQSRAPEQRANINRPILEQWAESARWHGLEVHSIEGDGPGQSAATMEFSAHFSMNGRRLVHREIAAFQRQDDRWYYVNGRLAASPTSQPVRVAASAGRNDPCPCGSGKKFKKCCAVA